MEIRVRRMQGKLALKKLLTLYIYISARDTDIASIYTPNLSIVSSANEIK